MTAPKVFPASCIVAANIKGHKAGLDPNASASDCPYTDNFMPLRIAWWEGFNTGRVTLSKNGNPSLYRSLKLRE
ncbi:hypothetical protein [Roseomonas harenae]|uniref:hypothetical protein n=1 Tax=Muricoccus harenae TaxID=2692566 RepID=UPI001331792C|nr:hypothetical protein [Roseomonas harenae]